MEWQGFHPTRYKTVWLVESKLLFRAEFRSSDSRNRLSVVCILPVKGSTAPPPILKLLTGACDGAVAGIYRPAPETISEE